MAWVAQDRCPRCGSRLESHTDSTRRCTVCVRFDALSSNSRRPRRDGQAPGLDITLEEFAAWFASQQRVCAYCSIPEHLVTFLGLRTQVGLPLARLGVDRPDTDRPYATDNIVLCCFACNKAKSNTFDSAEMTVVGRAVARVWQKRLGEAGLMWRFGEPDAAPL